MELARGTQAVKLGETRTFLASLTRTVLHEPGRVLAGIEVAWCQAMSRFTHFQLLARGDLAIQHGDSRTLAQVARHLGIRVGDPIAGQCETLALTCGNNQSSAAAWNRLRRAIVDRAATAGT